MMLSTALDTLCRVMKSWKPLKAMLASKEAKLLLASSKAMARWPLAAAAREKRPCPAPISNRTCWHTIHHEYFQTPFLSKLLRLR